MPIVVYQCDTCKREIELERNIRGLETVQRCVITHGCRGKLYQTNVLQDYIRGSLPEDVVGLENYQQRKVLHNHTQSIEKTEWVIEHGMGTNPAVSVFVNRPTSDDPDNQEEIIPTDTTIIDSDTIKLTFDRPWAGIAQLVARQSDPDLLTPITRTVQTTVPPVQLSNSGEISIATRVYTNSPTPSSVDLTVVFTTTSGDDVQHVFSVDDQPSLDSAWSDYDRIIIKGKIYVVRSFNAIIPEIANNTILSGSTFRFTTVDKEVSGVPTASAPIEAGDVIVLLASSPYEVFDKITDQYIDAADVTETNNSTSLAYNDGEFFANTSIIKPVYPLIREV